MNAVTTSWQEEVRQDFPQLNPPATPDQQRIRKELLEKSGRSRRAYWCVKRTFDVICSLTALIVLSPALLLIALLIFLDDPHGSPIYSQDRVGRHEKVFKFYKFRSMVVGADKMVDSLADQNEKDGPVFKIKDDPRITRIGHFIRKTSIDELPQLYNILKGDMSIVGPRPPLPREVCQYNDYQLMRLFVTPGLTCYWQTTPHRDQVSFEDWVDMDIQYIRDRSFWLDLKLIWKTVLCCIGMQGE